MIRNLGEKRSEMVGIPHRSYLQLFSFFSLFLSTTFPNCYTYFAQRTLRTEPYLGDIRTNANGYVHISS